MRGIIEEFSFKKGNESGFIIPKPSTPFKICVGNSLIKCITMQNNSRNEIRYVRSFDFVHKLNAGDKYLNVRSTSI